MVTRMSSDAMATAAAASQRSWASMKRSSRARSSADVAPADHSARRAGRCACMVARARCRALLAAATLVSSSAAVSAAGQPSTSRSDQRRPLAGRQHLHGGQERELDRLPVDGHGVGLVVGRGRPRRAAGRGRAGATAPRRRTGRRSAACDRRRSRSRHTLVAMR